MLRLLPLMALALLPGCTTGGDDDDPTHGGHESHYVDEEDDAGPPPKAGGGAHTHVADGSLEVETKHVDAAVRHVRDRVEKGGGQIVEEELSQGADRKISYARLRLRLPSSQASSMAQWLAKTYHVSHSRLRFEDASGADAGTSTKHMVTLDVHIEQPWSDDEEDRGRAWIRVGARWVGAFVSQRGSTTAPAGSNTPLYRHGSGLMLMTPKNQEFGLSVDVFDRETEKSQPVLVTLGGSGYSTYLGSGKRSYLNPTLGMHAGYASFGEVGNFALDGEIGLELVRWRQVLLHTFGRGLVLMNKDGSTLGREYGMQLLVPF